MKISHLKYLVFPECEVAIDIYKKNALGHFLSFTLTSLTKYYIRRLKTIEKWFSGLEFARYQVNYGYNGIVARGKLSIP